MEECIRMLTFRSAETQSLNLEICIPKFSKEPMPHFENKPVQEATGPTVLLSPLWRVEHYVATIAGSGVVGNVMGSFVLGFTSDGSPNNI